MLWWCAFSSSLPQLFFQFNLSICIISNASIGWFCDRERGNNNETKNTTPFKLTKWREKKKKTKQIKFMLWNELRSMTCLRLDSSQEWSRKCSKEHDNQSVSLGLILCPFIVVIIRYHYYFTIIINFSFAFLPHFSYFSTAARMECGYGSNSSRQHFIDTHNLRCYSVQFVSCIQLQFNLYANVSCVRFIMISKWHSGSCWSFCQRKSERGRHEDAFNAKHRLIIAK